MGTKKGPSTEGGGGSSCCRIESLIRVDERGQIVLPKEIRDKANIYPGDRLALICLKKKGTIYCFYLVKIGELTGIIKDLLGDRPKFPRISKKD